MHTVPGGLSAPNPPVVSLVTGAASYSGHNTRRLLHTWIDHPQRLWDAVYGTLAAGIRTVVHVGPAPNLIPATFRRLADNVLAQTRGRTLNGLGLRAIAGLARRPWLAQMLPSQAALARAPYVQHVILEDWLLEQPADPGGRRRIVPVKKTDGAAP
jgi:[acyl-carrier-protein] S-malonyltransferase